MIVCWLFTECVSGIFGINIPNHRYIVMSFLRDLFEYEQDQNSHDLGPEIECQEQRGVGADLL